MSVQCVGETPGDVKNAQHVPLIIYILSFLSFLTGKRCLSVYFAMIRTSKTCAETQIPKTRGVDYRRFNGPASMWGHMADYCSLLSRRTSERVRLRIPAAGCQTTSRVRSLL